MKQLISLFLAAVLLTLALTVPAAAADGFRLIGDVDEDGSVTILDATCIQRSLASLRPLSALQRCLGDVDGVGGVTILDATEIQRTVADLSLGFYKHILYTWHTKIESVEMSPSVSSLTVGETTEFHIDESAHEIPSEYAVYIGGELLRERSENPRFSYTFAESGRYEFTVISYDPFGGEDTYRFDLTVRSREELKPKIIYAVYNRNSEILSAIASGGTAPYQYQYIIRHDVSALPPGDYVTESAFIFSYDENGIPILKCPFCDDSAVRIPTDLLTKTLTYTCEVQVRDAAGNLSEVRRVAITP